MSFSHENNILIVIAGPTAIGKTNLSIQLAKYFNSEIISADSRQFYREMKIGTASPDLEEMNGVKHHFVGNLSIINDYNAGKYESDCLELIDKLFLNNRKLILTGGSGLFIDAVLNGFDSFPEVKPELRNELIDKFKKNGLEWLKEQVKLHDPDYFEIVDHQNHQRLLRAMEVYLSTGKKYSSYRTGIKKIRNFRYIKILLNEERKLLYDKINKRVDIMMENGLLSEVKSLVSFKKLNTLNTVGYKELFSYLEGSITLENAISLIKQNTRRYAKRQLTWFRKDEEYTVFLPTELNKIISFIEMKLNQIH